MKEKMKHLIFTLYWAMPLFNRTKLLLFSVMGPLGSDPPATEPDVELRWAGIQAKYFHSHVSHWGQRISHFMFEWATWNSIVF